MKLSLDPDQIANLDYVIIAEPDAPEAVFDFGNPARLSLDRVEDGSLVRLFNSSPEGRERALRMAEDWSKSP